MIKKGQLGKDKLQKANRSQSSHLQGRGYMQGSRKDFFEMDHAQVLWKVSMEPQGTYCGLKSCALKYW